MRNWLATAVGLVDVAARVAAQVEDDPVGAGRLDVAEDRLEVVRGTVRELVEPDQRGLGPGHHRPGDGLVGDLGADHRELPLGPGRAGPDRDDDGRAGRAADPADDVVDRVAGGGLAVDRHDLVADDHPGLLGRAALEDADDERQAVGRGIDPDADADVLARQVVRVLGALFGREERGVAGVADGLGHAVDGAVDEVAVVELRGADVLAVQDVPGLLDEAEGRRRRVVGSRGRRSEAAQGGQIQAADPDPDAERQHQRESDRRTTERRTASTAGRR